MRFYIGLATGVVMGALGAVAYSVATDTDLRQLFKQVQTELQNVDVEKIQASIQTGVADAQTQFDARMTEVRAATDSVVEKVSEAVESVVGTPTPPTEDDGSKPAPAGASKG